MNKSIRNLSIADARQRCLESLKGLTEKEKAEVLAYAEKIKSKRYTSEGCVNISK